MKYTVNIEEYGGVSLESNFDHVVLFMGDSETEFTKDEFKEFRRAVSYVWQEVENA